MCKFYDKGVILQIYTYMYVKVTNLNIYFLWCSQRKQYWPDIAFMIGYHYYLSAVVNQCLFYYDIILRDTVFNKNIPNENKMVNSWFKSETF